MTKQNWMITAIGSLVFIVGVMFGSSTEVKFGHCRCCHECSAFGIYWPTECHPDPKPEPKPEPFRPVPVKPGRGAALGAESP